MSTAELILGSVTGVLIPLAILIVGNWLRKQQQEANRAQRNADRVSFLVGHLASEKVRERLLAIHILKYLRDAGDFPRELLNTVSVIAASDTPEVAGAALLALGETVPMPDELVLLELLAPIKIHLDRTAHAFVGWKARDEEVESVIKKSNQYIHDLLMSKSHLIPEDLRDDAGKLVEHYDAWLAEYARVYRNGVRDPEEPFIFVGTKGFPFPREAAQNFLARFEQLRAKAGQETDSH